MIRVLLQSLRAVLVFTVLTGILYPLAVTAVARIAFKEQALGSRVHDRSGRLLIGSSLIAQGFSTPEYFWPRPSAAGSSGYDATSSGGTNQSPVGSDAIARVTSERLRLKVANPEAPGEPPLLLVTSSGSGLDPHLSPEAALWQAPRIARARHLKDVTRVTSLVEDLTEPRTFGVLGEPRVNVLELNLELDRRFPLGR
jgi:K+-transporting ATPase ATPase C chain